MTQQSRLGGDVSSEITDRVLKIVDDFEEAWQQGRQPVLDEFLPDYALLRRPVLIRLVHVDLEYRLQAGEAARVEAYLKRFAELAADTRAVVDLIGWEFTLRRRRETGLTVEEYLQRFPQFSLELPQTLTLDPSPRNILGETAPGETTITLANASAPDTPGLASETLAPAKPSTGAPGEWPVVPGYEILGELGRGAMGVVYKARQVKLKRLVALKMIQAGTRAGREDRMTRFHREAEAVARLQHPNIVQIYEVGEAQGRPFFSLELVEGGSLADRLDGTPWPARDAAQMVETLARAMQAAHQKNIIHRDLKPANVLLVSGGVVSDEGGSGPTTHPLPRTTHQPKIADFGLAKQLDQELHQTQSGAIVGTPGYMAPEQALGKNRVGQVGPAADVYALGAILYELLTGRAPFRGANLMEILAQVIGQEPVAPSRLQAKVPVDLETICLKCLAKEPARRYTSALALAQDLERFRSGESILARPEGRARKLWRKVRRNRAAFLATLAGAAVLIVLAFVALRWDQTRKLVDLEHAIDNGLSPEVWTPEHLEQVETMIANLDPFAPERAAEYRERLLKLFRNDLRALLERPRLSEEHVRRFKVNAHALDSRQPGTEEDLLKRLTGRLRVWENILNVEPPFDRGTKAFVNSDFRSQNNALHRARGRNPLMLLQTKKGSGMEIEARFDHSWAAAEAVGVYLNAGRAHPKQVRSLALDGFLASAGPDGVCVWKIDSGARKAILEYPGAASCVAFSGWWLVAGVGKQVVVWNLQSVPPSLVTRVEAHEAEVRGIALTRDGKWLATGGADGTVKVWGVQATPSAPTLRKTLNGPEGAVNQVAFTYDARTLGAACEDGTVRFWDVGPWTAKAFVARHKDPVWSLALHMDNRTLATACKDQVTLWDMDEGKEWARTPARTAPVHCLAFTLTWEKQLAIGSTVLFPERGKLRPKLDQSRALVSAVAFAPLPQTLAAFDEADGTVWLCDPKTGRRQLTSERGRGYAFLVSATRLLGSSSTAQEGGRPPGARPGMNRRYLQIVRDGVCLHERVVAVPEGPLTLRGIREGNELRMQVNRLDPVTLLDPFPLLHAEGDAGVHWPPQVGLASLVVRGQAEANAPSALENADRHFTDGQHEQALSIYRDLTLGGGPAVEEASYKAALCLEKLKREEEALRSYEKVSPGDRWGMLAGWHLWALHRKRKEFDQAEAAVASAAFRFKKDQALLVLPGDMRNEIFHAYFLSLVGSNYVLPPSDLAERLERQAQIVEMVPDLPISREEAVRAVILAHQIQDRAGKALTRAESYLRESAQLESWERLRVAWVLAEYTWLLQGQKKADKAREELDRWVFTVPPEIPAENFYNPRPLSFLLMERARLDCALKDWDAVKADVALCLKIFEDRSMWGAEIVTQARLIQGFALEAQGDPVAARKAWEEAALRRAVGKDATAVKRFWENAHLREMLPQLIQAGLTNDLSDPEAEAVMTKLVQPFVANKAMPLSLKSVEIFDKPTYQSFYRSLGTMWRTKRGQVLARKLILHQVSAPEAIRLPSFLVGHEMVRQQAFGGSYNGDQDELVWKLILDCYDLVRGGKLTKKSFPVMGIAWLFGTTGAALTSTLQELPAHVQGPLAYVFGKRMLVKKPAAARSFFKMALRDADSSPTLKALVQAELGRMK